MIFSKINRNCARFCAKKNRLGNLAGIVVAKG